MGLCVHGPLLMTAGQQPIYEQTTKKLHGDTLLPPVTLRHLKALTDCTGILQHAKYAIPNRFEGYCVDDNVRALLVAAKHYSLFRDESTFDLLRTYMAFTFHAQNDDGTMRNFMSYQRSFLDSVGSDEVLGRTLWRADTREALRISPRTSEKLPTSFLNAQRCTRPAA